MNEKSSLSTVLYGSWGRGGGTGSVGSRVRTADGQVDFDAIQANNEASADGSSTYALRASVNSHQWFGLVTNYETKLNDNITMNLGLDARNYTGLHFRQIIDLLGADHFLDTRHSRIPNNKITAEYEADPWKALSDYAEEDERYDRDYNETINYAGVFGQLEYANNDLSAFIQGSVSSQSHVRLDRYNETEENEDSDKVTNPGFNIKTGVNYNINSQHSVFVNAGLYSRQPFHDNIYLNRRNTVNEVADNEQITGFELGYRYRGDDLLVNVNVYRTYWQDRFDTRSVFEGDTVVVDNQEFIFDDDGFNNLTNLNQLHQGVEVDFKYRITGDLDIRGYASIGNWEFDGTTRTNLHNARGDLLASEDNLDVDGNKVGGSAQTSFGVGINYNITRDLDVYVDYNYYDNLYGNSSPFSDADAIELPSYGLLDMGIGYKFLLSNGQVIRLRANMYNVLDELYIAYSRNNDAPDADDANNWEGVNKSNSVHWGLGRTWNVSARYSF
jgi:hypothetical protein